MADGNIDNLLFSGTLAFLAFLPSAISIMVSYYNSERHKEYTGSPDDLKYFRRSIYSMQLGLVAIVFTYFIALDMMVGWVDVLLNGPYILFSPVRVATSILSLAVLLISGGLSVFLILYFKRTDGINPLTTLLPKSNDDD